MLLFGQFGQYLYSDFTTWSKETCNELDSKKLSKEFALNEAFQKNKNNNKSHVNSHSYKEPKVRLWNENNNLCYKLD